MKTLPLSQIKDWSIKLGTLVFLSLMVVVLQPSKDVNAQGTSVFFPVGPGYADVVPHQIVRTNDDRVYIVGGVAQYQTRLAVYWTQQAGLPSTNGFTGKVEIQLNVEPISVDAAYDGADIIHLLINTRGSALYDYPFNIRTNTVKPRIPISTNSATVSGDYLGTSGLSGMFDKTGLLHVVYWQTGNHVIYQPFSYAAANNTLQAASAPATVDKNGKANHPALAVSPLDGSVTIAWVSEFTNPVQILARSRAVNGTWGNEEVVSNTPVWTSTYFGLNIDQGPSLLIDTAGTKHLSYIQGYDNSGDYGRVHYVRRAASDTAWADTALNTYSHDPVMAINSGGEIYVIGHGPMATGQNTDIYMSKRNNDGSWGAIQLLAKHTGSDSFDASPSVKWSAVGWNRPESIEVIFFSAVSGSYNNTNLYYGRLPASGSPIVPTSTPITPTSTPIPSMTLVPPTSTFTPTNTLPPPTSTPLPTNTATAQPIPTVPTARVDVSPGVLDVGTPVSVTINLFNVTSLYGVQVDCAVDPTKLVGVSRSGGTIFSDSNSFFVDPGPGSNGHWMVAVTRLQPNPVFDGNGSAFVLQYQTLAEGTTPINCSILAVDNKGTQLALQVTNGTVTINPSLVTLSPQPTIEPTIVPPTATSTVAPTFTLTPEPPTATPTATETPVVVEPATPTLTPIAGAKSSIQGSASYQNAPDNAGINIQLDKDGVLVTQMVTLADGLYAFTDLPVGSYTVLISAPLHLTTVYQITLNDTTPSMDLGSQVLLAGDTDGNQTIDLVDATFISANFTQNVPPAPQEADLNRDRKIDIVDLVLIGGNFGLTGPIIAQP